MAWVSYDCFYLFFHMTYENKLVDTFLNASILCIWFADINELSKDSNQWTLCNVSKADFIP